MKRLFLFSAIAVFMAGAAVAQEAKDKAVPDQKPTPPTEQKQVNKAPGMQAARAAWEKKIREDLKLTPDQSAKFDALNKEYNEKIDVISQDASLGKDAQKEKKMTLKKEKEARLFEILTPEQQAGYKQMIETKKKEMETKEAKPGS